MAQVLAQQGASRAPVGGDDARAERDDGAHDGHDDNAGASASPAPLHAALPLVALVLGISGVALGVTVVWFFAAIPVGVVSLVTGVIARQRLHTYNDPRAASRATIGTALGCVAILLGVTGAYFLPRLIDRGDRFLGGVQENVNKNVGLVNGGLSRDVNRLDRTLSRDLDRFELQNRTDLTALENRTALTLKALEERLNSAVDVSRTSAKSDLAALDATLRAALQAVEKSSRESDAALHATVGGLDERISRIEQKLGM
jgi:hypothetical protein